MDDDDDGLSDMLKGVYVHIRHDPAFRPGRYSQTIAGLNALSRPPAVDALAALASADRPACRGLRLLAAHARCRAGLRWWRRHGVTWWENWPRWAHTPFIPLYLLALIVMLPFALPGLLRERRQRSN